MLFLDIYKKIKPIIEKILEKTVPKTIKHQIDKLVEQSKDKKLMKEKFGCQFCAFYSQIDLPNDKLKNLLEKDFLKKMLKIKDKAFLSKLLSMKREERINHASKLLKNIEKNVLKLKDKYSEENILKLKDILSKYVSLKKEEKIIVESEVLKYLEEHIPEYFDELKSKLPSLCIYKNKIDPTPCIHYSLRVLDVSIKDRLDYQNSKNNRRYVTLGVFITTIFSILAITISIYALFT